MEEASGSVSIQVISIILALIAISFTALKDFILPYFRKPVLAFKYEDKKPFRRENLGRSENVLVGESLKRMEFRATYLRFSVTNIGKSPASNCRCQVLKVIKDETSYGDYHSFPLRWACRSGEIERLNIGLYEKEFIDFIVTKTISNNIFFEKYSNAGLGMKEFLEPGEWKYNIHLLFSGDNFNPYRLIFCVEKPNDKDINNISLKLIEYTQL